MEFAANMDNDCPPDKLQPPGVNPPDGADVLKLLSASWKFPRSKEAVHFELRFEIVHGDELALGWGADRFYYKLREIKGDTLVTSKDVARELKRDLECLGIDVSSWGGLTQEYLSSFEGTTVQAELTSRGKFTDIAFGDLVESVIDQMDDAPF